VVISMSEAGGVVVGGMQLKRVDLVGIRRRIGAALGQEKLRKYWDILKRYTQFKLSKFELDANAIGVLGAENVPLHNELIRGIFQNALLGLFAYPRSFQPHSLSPLSLVDLQYWC
jgi:hypothetical protein